ncbi:MAG: DNA-3-methyladenine glycosylase I [Flavobacteriales bacterium]|nr:DNA-3-methyladenine glycosylase I [Flavobacteriales bacterium]
MDKKRCDWPNNELMITYHDEEWGVPQHDDKKLFEFLLLESFQAGLSWETILKKRENFLDAFDDFDYAKIATYNEDKVQDLLQNAGIIRNKLKVRSAIQNAILFMNIQKEYGSFDKYIWQFVGGKTITNNLNEMSGFVASTSESDAMSKDLKKRGFKFVGSTICYAYMQATGMVNDHMDFCFRKNEVK